MNRRTVAALFISGGLLLGGCGAAESESPSTDQAPVESSTAGAPPQSQEAVEAATAMDVAKQLEGEIPTITAVTEVTEDNDANNLIGRPGQYVSAAWITDKAGVSKETGIDGGAVVEVFATPENAQTRSEYIQSVLTEGGGVLGTEYHYLKDSRLLRVSGNLKPSSAKTYESAAAK